MATIKKMEHDGGFVVGDTETGATAYAYPTSPHAINAKRRPDAVADCMVVRANRYGTHMTRYTEALFHQRNWVRLLAIG